MVGVELRATALGLGLEDRLILIGLTTPPDLVARHLDAGGFDALAKLRLLVYLRATLKAELLRHEVEPVIEAVNESLVRNGWRGTGLWTLPPEAAAAGCGHRDALGLDVAAAWGAEELVRIYRQRSFFLQDVRHTARMQAAADRVAEVAVWLQETLERSAGFGRRAVAPSSPGLIGMIWRHLREALDKPNVPGVDLELIMDKATKDATRLRVVASNPEPDHAS